jgi:hypothetical protein
MVKPARKLCFTILQPDTIINGAGIDCPTTAVFAWHFCNQQNKNNEAGE